MRFPDESLNIYLDNNATTKLLPEVRTRIMEIISESYGNPSSPHSYANFSRKIIEDSRNQIAEILNSDSRKILFTSGATESNRSVFYQLTRAPAHQKAIITTPSEHASVKFNSQLLSTQGFKVIELSINNNGVINISELRKIFETEDVALVSVGWASNETGVIQPVNKIGELCSQYNAYFHCDASQYIGRGTIDLKKVKIDFLSFTGHKLHAPQGIGVLYIRSPERFIPLFGGGEQEYRMRAGTENIIGIAAIGKAIEIRRKKLRESIDYLRKLQSYFEGRMKSLISDLCVNGESTNRTPNTSSITFEKIDGRALMGQLDMVGIYCSQTSACTSMIPEPSETLLAMGLTVDEAFASIRFSFAVDNTRKEIEIAVGVIADKVKNIRKFYDLRKAV